MLSGFLTAGRSKYLRDELWKLHQISERDQNLTVLLGAIADDYTGATDLANTLVKEGMPTIQTFGVPKGGFDLSETAAIVVALKTRSVPVKEAIQESIEATRWLGSLGVGQFFFKYCSTFDSTDKGNIGPVADAILDELGSAFTIACPAFPTNERTVYKGHLFVGDVLLSDSGMRDHPLTPMTDSNLVRVLGRQTPNKVGLVKLDDVQAGAEKIAEKLSLLARSGHRFAIVDAISDRDLVCIGQAARDLKLITGGSGIAIGLPENFRQAGLLDRSLKRGFKQTTGRSAVMSGSCSDMTRAQIAAVKDRWANFFLDPLKLAESREALISDVLTWVDGLNSEKPFLIYSSADPNEVKATHEKLGREQAGLFVEQAMSVLAKELVSRGIRQLIVAGGETSGAVVKALGVDGLRIGREIDPGVPWCETIGETKLSLALKSGNFGSTEFFVKALEMLKQ
jgi:uncharacterized protein YgbK (DUF1537 family)